MKKWFLVLSVSFLAARFATCENFSCRFETATDIRQ